MLVSTKIMDMLKTIGLNLYERKLWISLLAKGTATAGELSQMSNVPRSRTYDTLESLAEKGFVITQVGKPVRFVAMKPEEALERVKKKIESDTEEMKKRIDELKKSGLMKELNDLFGKGVKTLIPEEFTGTIKGKDHLEQQMSFMFRSANKRIQIVTNIEGLKDLYQNHYNGLKKAKDRGVDIKIASMTNESCRDAIKTLNNIATVKCFDNSASVKGNFYIVDSKELVFYLTDPAKVHETQHVALWSKSEHAIVDVLEPLFKIVWENSK
jgi:sugar-specific transcriptional regulator TrmB